MTGGSESGRCVSRRNKGLITKQIHELIVRAHADALAESERIMEARPQAQAQAQAQAHARAHLTVIWARGRSIVGPFHNLDRSITGARGRVAARHLP